ncbi:hypothetical protein DFS34DRAFT_632681 [Phlyctochytrium arcticum]|nr:hypothetical protein DFS34DRAFT_632681 [Phlyctochytrium arcticum]
MLQVPTEQRTPTMSNRPPIPPMLRAGNASSTPKSSTSTPALKPATIRRTTPKPAVRNVLPPSSAAAASRAGTSSSASASNNPYRKFRPEPGMNEVPFGGMGPYPGRTGLPPFMMNQYPYLQPPPPMNGARPRYPLPPYGRLPGPPLPGASVSSSMYDGASFAGPPSRSKGRHPASAAGIPMSAEPHSRYDSIPPPHPLGLPPRSAPPHPSMLYPPPPLHHYPFHPSAAPPPRHISNPAAQAAAAEAAAIAAAHEDAYRTYLRYKDHPFSSISQPAPPGRHIRFADGTVGGSPGPASDAPRHLRLIDEWNGIVTYINDEDQQHYAFLRNFNNAPLYLPSLSRIFYNSSLPEGIDMYIDDKDLYKKYLKEDADHASKAGSEAPAVSATKRPAAASSLRSCLKKTSAVPAPASADVPTLTSFAAPPIPSTPIMPKPKPTIDFNTKGDQPTLPSPEMTPSSSVRGKKRKADDVCEEDSDPKRKCP